MKGITINLILQQWKESPLILHQATGINQGCSEQARKYSPSEANIVVTAIFTDKETEANIKDKNLLTSKM